MSEVEFFINGLSIHGQFDSLQEFAVAVEEIMKIQKVIYGYKRTLYCDSEISNAEVLQGLSIQKAVPMIFSRDQQRVLLGWLNKHGPFWDDERHHEPGDYFECNGDVVTDTVLGEVAYRCEYGVEHHLVSFSPSQWMQTSIKVLWHFNDMESKEINIQNHLNHGSVRVVLESAVEPPETWAQLENHNRNRLANIRFSMDCFEFLQGHPFAPGAAAQISRLLYVLDRYQSCLDETGRRSTEGHRLYNEHFTGGNSWFSDSSDTEKNRFRKELTFQHPDKPDENLFCSWHGKIRSAKEIRIHFSWPVDAEDFLYVVYVGPKITKK